MLNDYRKSESEFGPIDTDFFNTIGGEAAVGVLTDPVDEWVTSLKARTFAEELSVPSVLREIEGIRKGKERAMQIDLPIQPEQFQTAQDAADRLSVIYPQLSIAVEPGRLLIASIPDSMVEEVRQAAKDQLIRSRYASETAELRAVLYRRLLG